MKRLSHLTVALATLMLLLFGTGGIGWQRCSCTGRVSLLLPTHKGCCGNNSSCMKVTITQVSTADLQTEKSALPQWASITLFHTSPLAEMATPMLTHSERLLRHSYWYPPGWTATRGMVMRV